MKALSVTTKSLSYSSLRPTSPGTPRTWKRSERWRLKVSPLFVLPWGSKSKNNEFFSLPFPTSPARLYGPRKGLYGRGSRPPVCFHSSGKASFD